MSGRALLALLSGLWVAVALLAPLLGAEPVSLGDLWQGEPLARAIVVDLRLPRVLLGLLSGAVLGAVGLAFQTVFRNPLAEPYTLGIASGAALGAALVFVTGTAAVAGLPAVAAASFAGAVAATVLVVLLGGSRRPGPGGAGATLLLAGVAVAFTCQALILFVQYLADATETLRMVRWMMGGLGVVGFREVFWLLPWALGAGAVLFAVRWDLDLLLAGEELAAGRGGRVGRLRILVLATNAFAVGAAVAVVGPIGFVGLMVPHILRRIGPSTHTVLVPACLLGGGVFLVLCDLGARLVLAPAELPVGIVTALLGGPFFLWLLRRQ